MSAENDFLNASCQGAVNNAYWATWQELPYRTGFLECSEWQEKQNKKLYTEEDMLAAFNRKIGIQTIHEGCGKTWLKEYNELKNK